ncbi:MAG: DUF3617 family protein [Spirochaetes bacterium]|nr:DUF3617 family protein [Spirochaetota bacterium]
MKKFAITIMAVFFFMAVLFAASIKMREGKWEVTMTMNIPGMPMAMPPVTHTQCITKKDLEDNKKTLPSAGKSEDCEIKNYRVKDNTVTWETVCKDGTRGSGQIIYKGDSYTGTMKLETVDRKGQKSTINYKIKGQRKGDC